jgi:membrane-bound ClpP family serine protease
MTIGFFAVLIELFHPGALLPGVSGVVCLVLSFVGFAALPMNGGGVVLILAAAALFILDIKAAAHGGLTIAGLICFALGSLLLYSPPSGTPSPTLPDVSVALPALLAATGYGLLSLPLLGQARFGIGGALVRCIRALLTMETDRWVPRIVGRFVRWRLVLGIGTSSD